MNCRFSHQFLEILKKFPEINGDFQKYPLESMRGQLPAGLNSVPTVLERESGKMYASQQAFDWLKNKIRNSFKPADDITQGSSEFSFINGTDETYISSLFSQIDTNAQTSAFDQNNGTKINPNDFTQDGKPIRQTNNNNNNFVQHPQLTPQQFNQMNEQMNNIKTQETGLNPNVPLDIAMRQRESMELPQIQKNVQQFQANVNQSFNQQPISNQQFQQVSQQYQQQFQQNRGNSAPPLPDALRPIDVTKQTQNYNLDAYMQQRDQEVPRPPNRTGGSNSYY